MDVQMPEMDGFEATQKIKALNLKNLPPIVAMTAYSMEEDKARFLSQGLDDYLPKPIKAVALIEKVKSWVNFAPKSVATEVFTENTEDLVINQNTLNQLHKYGGKELIQSVLEDFDQEASEIITNSKVFLKKKEMEELQRALHTLKGNAGTFGLEKLSKNAEYVEKKIKANNFKALKKDLEELEKTFVEFQESYHNLFNN